MASEKKGKDVKIFTVPTSQFLPKKKADVRKKLWHIDKEMLRFKIHYFLLSGAFGTSLPYLPILAQKRVGISASALAAILTIQRVIFIFAKPSIGYIADYFNKLKTIICILAAVASVSLFAVLAVPKFEKGTEETTFPRVDYNRIKYEIINTSETYMVCEIRKSNSSQPVQVIQFNNSKNDDPSFHSLHDFSDFLSNCSENEKNGSQNTSNNIEYTFILEHKFNNLSLPSNSFICKLYCKLTNKCQTFLYTNSKSGGKEILYETKDESDFQRYQFWLYALFATVAQGCCNSLFTLTDTACCESVQKTGAQFGRQCLFGAVGWGLMCPIGGLLNDYTGDFLASWILMAIMVFISLQNFTKLEIVNPAFSENLLKDVGSILSSKEFLVFMFCVVMNGVGIGITWFYLVLFLTDIGGSRFLCGMVMFVQNFVAGIPFMFFSGWVIKKIGHFNVLTISLLAYSIRFFWYSQLHNPWLVLPVEILNGFNEGLIYTTVASYAKLSAKPGTEATTQAVLFTAHEGIGIGIGCVAAGLGFDTIGGHRTFLYLSIYAGCAMLISIILHLFLMKRKRIMNVTPSTNT